MGSLQKDVLGLDLRLFATKTIKNSPKDVVAGENDQEKVAKLEDTIKSLEMERAKIEVFKRELPISTHLIGDVIEWLKDELEQCRRPQELMPTKKKFEEKGGVKLELDCNDKMNWMSSVPLWSGNNNSKNTNFSSKKPSEEKNGAFVPFNGSLALAANSEKEVKGAAAAAAAAVPELSLSSPAMDTSCTVAEERRGDMPSTNCFGGTRIGGQCEQAPQRKARRCWSPELHRRFVSALQRLGGAQVATPKQIRELMKVDGLTNDEVKSHLQKYRLHTRRALPAGAGQPGMVVGNMWPPQEQYSTSQHSTSQSGSPQGPLQLTGSSRAVSVTAGDSCEEEEEDGRSESHSWNLRRS